MTMQQTSLLMWDNIVRPELTEREQAVIDTIQELGEACINTCAAKMGVTPNVISGRFTALKRKGMIERTERKPMANGHMADWYKVA